ncbi:MAG: hypothetical protein ACRENB_09295 [Gemmatimonadales bacterium]
MITLLALAVALQAPVTQDTTKKDPAVTPVTQDTTKKMKDQNQALSVEVTKTRETLIQNVPSGIQGWVTSEAAKFTTSREAFTTDKARAAVTARFTGLGSNEVDALAFLIATDVALKAQAQHAAAKGVGAGVPPRDPPVAEKAKGTGPADFMARYSEAEKVANGLQKTAGQASADALKALKIPG